MSFLIIEDQPENHKKKWVRFENVTHFFWLSDGIIDSGYSVPGFASGKNSIKVVKGTKAHGIAGLAGGAADVRQHEDVIIRCHIRVSARLVAKTIKPCSSELP